MRVYQVIDGMVHWVTPYHTLTEIEPETYTDEIMAQFVESEQENAQSYWAYKDGVFTPPEPAPEPEPQPEPEPSPRERIAAAVEYKTVSMMPNGGNDFYAQTDYDASPDERIAAALEYQTIAAMPDVPASKQ